MSDEPTVKRWRRYGQDRTYVSTAAGEALGWRDNATGQLHLTDEAHRFLVEEVLASTGPGAAPAGNAPPADHSPSALQAPTPKGSGEAEPPAVDLSLNVAGQAARRRAVEMKEAAPTRTAIARVLGIHTDERAWRLGAKGESKVGTQLAKLGPEWHVIHAIPVGVEGADIDHLVIGAGGVYSLNAKHHPNAKIWVADDTFLVNGRRVPYVRNSRHEAKRASRLLGRALGRTIAVTGVIVPVAASDLVIKQLPADVRVVPRRQIAKWLRNQPHLLDAAAVQELVRAARDPATWRGAAD